MSKIPPGLLPWRWFRGMNGEGGTTARYAMNETVTKELRQALDDPKTRYLIVDAWRNRKARESGGRSGAASLPAKDAKDRPKP